MFPTLLRAFGLIHCFFPMAHAGVDVTTVPPGTPNDPHVEFRQDFKDFDLDSNGNIDPQEIRAQFKGDLDNEELFTFITDVDTDHDGLVKLQEYINYASQLS